MWHFLKRQAMFFLVGFVLTFLVYLFVRFSADAVVLGIVIATAGGLAVSTVIFWLERRFPDRTPAPGDQ
jgi:hypothetical protein